MARASPATETSKQISLKSAVPTSAKSAYIVAGLKMMRCQKSSQEYNSQRLQSSVRPFENPADSTNKPDKLRLLADLIDRQPIQK